MTSTKSTRSPRASSTKGTAGLYSNPTMGGVAIISAVEGFTELNVEDALELAFPDDVDGPRQAGAAGQILDHIDQSFVDTADVVRRQLTRMKDTDGAVLLADEYLRLATFRAGACGWHNTFLSL